MSAACENRSVAVSSNLNPAAFDGLMRKTPATATADRFLHHAHVCQTTGDSVRLARALAGQGCIQEDQTDENSRWVHAPKPPARLGFTPTTVWPRRTSMRAYFSEFSYGYASVRAL
jgi:hypothetical protein